MKLVTLAESHALPSVIVAESEHAESAEDWRTVTIRAEWHGEDDEEIKYLAVEERMTRSGMMARLEQECSRYGIQSVLITQN